MRCPTRSGATRSWGVGPLQLATAPRWRPHFQKIEYGERFARDLGTTVQRIDGGRHFTPEDHPDVVAAAVKDLVAEVRARS